MSLREELQSAVRGDVRDDAASLDAFSRDASLFRVQPSVVMSPADAADIGALVSFVSKAREAGRTLSLTARSGGTDMTGGPLTESIVLDMTAHFTRIGEVTGDEITVQPGVFYRDLERATLAKGLLLPTFPASREICTVGGMVANNAGGEKTLRYGKTADYVRRLKVVLADGAEHVIEPLDALTLAKKTRLKSFEGVLYREMKRLVDGNAAQLRSAKPRVSKNSAGYALWDVRGERPNLFDLTRVITGSQGTLGIVTEITFGLVRPKPHARLVVIHLKDFARIGEIADLVLRYEPESFESYDDKTFNVAIRLLPQLIKKMKGSFARLALSFLPDAWMVLTGGVPKLVMLAEFTGETADEAEASARACADELDRAGVHARLTHSEEEGQKYWTIRRESFNLLRKHVRGMRTAPFIDDLIVQPSELAEFLPKLYAILEPYKLTYTIAGHVGDGNFHIIPLVKPDRADLPAIIKELSESVYRLVIAHGGSITAEHNDGLVRSAYLEAMYGADVCERFRETKSIFDPLGLFNPGKKVGSNLDAALAHLDRGGSGV